MANLIRAKGLYTFGNELSIPEGSLVKAENINVDEQGVITPRRGNDDFGSSFGTEDDRLNQIMEYKDRIIRHYLTTLQYENDSGDFTSFSGSYNEIENGFRIKYQEANKNLYFTTDEGIKKISARNGSDLANVSITDAGGIKAVDLSATLVPTTGGFLASQSKVAYRIVWGTRDRNNNLILGSPSARYVLSNTSEDTNLSERSTVTFSGAPTGSNYLLLSSTTTTYTVWYQVSGSDTAPQQSDTVGTTFVEVDFQGTTNNDERANAFANALSSVAEFDVSVTGSTVDITTVAAGDTINIVEGTAGADANVAVATVVEGEITAGQTSNANVTFSIPDGITTDYFYQIYRTNIVTATEGLTLNDIDPGDEMNQVYEEAITDADLIAGSITVLDSVTESFRASGNILYTNPISGQGILQANERPPIAKDVALFRNSTFYANTKTAHSLQFNLLSVLDFTSGSSEFIVGSSSGIRRYTFVGVNEIIDITTDSRTNTTASSWINLYSANDERQYYLWFDTTGTDTPPSHASIDNALGIRVDLSQYADTAAGSNEAIRDALAANIDFEATDNSGDVRLTWLNNGDVTDATLGNTAPGGSWALANVQQGDGENAAAQEVLLSGLVSVSQAIDETARSLIRVINQDSSSDVNAFYLSTADSLPGIIRLESKDLTDEAFYLAVNDASIQEKFSPTLPLIDMITSITFSAGSNSPANINAAGHGLASGDEIYLYSPDTTPTIYGKYEVTVVDIDNFTVPFNITIEDNPSVNALFFYADAESDNLEKPNRVYYSKIGQPEAVPLLNFLDIGPEDEPIERILALRDNLFVLKTDGVYIITGTSAPNFTFRLLDNSTNITAPDSAVILNNLIYCLTTQGVATISESGVSVISRPIENRILNFANSNFDFRLPCFGIAYESDRAYILFAPERKTDTIATQAYRYNIFERTWSRWTVSSTCGKVKTTDDKLYLGDGTRNYLLQERKNLDRTDYADRDFTLQIPTTDVEGTSIPLSSVTDTVIGDVIVQEQYLTISVYNRLLRKLDIDNGLDDIDYNSTLSIIPGVNITNALQSLNDKLVTDDTSGTVTVKVISSDPETLQGQYNTLIGELNDPACDTFLKDYREFNDVYTYEGIILSKNTLENTITVNYALPLLLGDVQIYKGISTTIQWAPQHFGNPSALKQMREGTIIFDQNNFYSASLSYSSDLSQSFVETPFISKGVGSWGSGLWGEVKSYWGGEGNDAPFRTIVPREKQRARYLNVLFKHINAREDYRILGISIEVRQLSARAYR